MIHGSLRRYEDDRDEGEWFLYTGSGGRDLSGNKRVTSVQSFDQTFDKMNKALLTSCQKGLPVRVVRSAKARPTPAIPYPARDFSTKWPSSNHPFYVIEL